MFPYTIFIEILNYLDYSDSYNLFSINKNINRLSKTNNDVKIKLFESLFKKYIFYDKGIVSSACLSIKNNNINILIKLIEKYSNNFELVKLVAYSSCFGNEKILDLLLDKFKDSTDFNFFKELGLREACRKGHTHIVDKLLKDPKLYIDENAFKVALSNEYFDIVNLLIKDSRIFNRKIYNKKLDILLKNNNIVSFKSLLVKIKNSNFKRARNFIKNKDKCEIHEILGILSPNLFNMILEYAIINNRVELVNNWISKLDVKIQNIIIPFIKQKNFFEITRIVFNYHLDDTNIYTDYKLLIDDIETNFNMYLLL